MGQVIEVVPLPAKSGKKAAIISVIAPIIAVILNIASTTDLVKYSVYRPSLAICALVAAWAGFLAAVVGLIRGLSRLYAGAIVYSLAGLVLNAGLLMMAFGITLGVKGLVSGRSTKVTMIKLNSLPQVFENSTTIFNQKFGIRLELPAGFIENPDSASAAKSINSFVRYDDNGKPGITVDIVRMYRIMAPRTDKPSVDQVEELKRSIWKTYPYAVVDRVEQEQWKTHTLDAYFVEAPVNGEMVSMWIVQVPFAGEAIQIQVGGAADNEQGQYRKAVKQILKSLQGVSNWE